MELRPAEPPLLDGVVAVWGDADDSVWPGRKATVPKMFGQSVRLELHALATGAVDGRQ